MAQQITGKDKAGLYRQQLECLTSMLSADIIMQVFTRAEFVTIVWPCVRAMQRTLGEQANIRAVVDAPQGEKSAA